MPIPILQTERLILRPLHQGDAADMFAYAQDELVAGPGMWEPFESFEDCERFVADLLPLYEGELMWWALEHRADMRMIGRVELSKWSRQDARAELSFALHREYWRQGLMSEAATAAMDYGWNTLNLHRIWAKVYSNNAASSRLLMKLGMVKEGRLRDEHRIDGSWLDVDIYATLKSSESA